MKLQADNRRPNLDRLVFTALTSCEAARTGRQIEGLPVPMKDSCRRREVKDGFTRSGYALHGEPTDLLAVIRIDPGTERAGDKLRAEAYP